MVGEAGILSPLATQKSNNSAEQDWYEKLFGNDSDSQGLHFLLLKKCGNIFWIPLAGEHESNDALKEATASDPHSEDREKSVVEILDDDL